jgi:hypothetical protein
LKLTLAVYLLVFVLKLAVYFVTGVMALLAEAPHTLSCSRETRATASSPSLASAATQIFASSSRNSRMPLRTTA